MLEAVFTILGATVAAVGALAGLTVAISQRLSASRAFRREGYDLVEKGARLTESDNAATRLAGMGLMIEALRRPGASSSASAALRVALSVEPDPLVIGETARLLDDETLDRELRRAIPLIDHNAKADRNGEDAPDA